MLKPKPRKRDSSADIAQSLLLLEIASGRKFSHNYIKYKWEKRKLLETCDSAEEYDGKIKKIIDECDV
jgi:hypothetical protein